MIELIRIIHLAIVISVVVSPFIDNKYFKQQIIMLLLYILFRNLTGYNKCGLTELESKLSNKPIETGFIYKLVAPFSNISKYEFYRLIVPIQWWILIVLLYQLYYV